LFDPNNIVRGDIGNEANAKPSLSLTEKAKTTLANNNDSSKSDTTSPLKMLNLTKDGTARKET